MLEDYLPTLRFQPTVALSPDGRRMAHVDDALGQFNVSIQELASGRASAPDLLHWLNCPARVLAPRREVSYDVYPDEGHVFGKRGNRIKVMSVSTDFLLSHLLQPTERSWRL